MALAKTALIVVSLVAGTIILAELAITDPPPDPNAEEKRLAEATKQQEQWLALSQCQKAVKSQIKYPSKADFDPDSAPYVGRMAEKPTIIEVVGRAEFMNGVGAMIPHKYGCDVQSGVVINVAIEPG